jgi:three-Cys-motif partner protein
VVIGDYDHERLEAATKRLQRLEAPVVPLLGPAKDTAFSALQKADGFGLNFAFLDPYSLGTLDFEVISTLARLQRIDMLVHVSQMDLQRNFDRNAAKDESALDTFAPGWRSVVDTNTSQRFARQAYFDYWRMLVEKAGPKTNIAMKLITGPENQPLYLLLLAARHELAHRFWQIVAKKGERQQSLF